MKTKLRISKGIESYVTCGYYHLGEFPPMEMTGVVVGGWGCGRAVAVGGYLRLRRGLQII